LIVFFDMGNSWILFESSLKANKNIK